MTHLRPVRAILFDMDGTLYQDLDFHRDYIRYLLSGSPAQPLTQGVIALADEVLAGKTLPMNRFYRKRRHGDLTSIPALVDALRGDLAEGMPFEDCYREGPGDLQYVGDPWEVALLLTEALGFPPENGEAAFLRVREEMVAHALQPAPALLEVLLELKGRYTTVLLSNSPEESAASFIQRLGFSGAFSFVLYGAEKPYRLFENLHRCPQMAGIGDGELLSVGDHALNEIVNVRLAGGQTLWMNPYAEAPQVPRDLQVKDIPQLIQTLREELL